MVQALMSVHLPNGDVLLGSHRHSRPYAQYGIVRNLQKLVEQVTDDEQETGKNETLI